MLLLATVSDLIRLTCGTALGATGVHVHASWGDYTPGGGDPDFGRANASIGTTIPTTIVASPASGVRRTVRTLEIRNTHAATPTVVTIEHYDGSTYVQIEQRLLGPGQSIRYVHGAGWSLGSTGGSGLPMYAGQIVGCFGNGDPNYMMDRIQGAGWIGPTPTQIGATVARCMSFTVPQDMTAQSLRWYGIGAVSGIYTVAIYRFADLKRLTASIAITTVANAWGSQGSLALPLSKGVVYFVACSANTTGTTAGLAAIGTTTTATTGQIQSAPAGLPGSLSLSSGFLSGYRFQFTVAAGAMPDPAATPALPAAWTGGMPAFFLDAA